MAYEPLAGKGRSHGYNTCATVSGATESSVVDLHGFVNYGLMIPTIDTGDLTFKASNIEAGTYYTVTDKGGSTAFTVAAGTGGMAIESDDLKALAGYRYIKVVSASQTAERTFIWTVKG